MTHAAILFILTSIGIIIQKITGINVAPTISSQRYLDLGGAEVNNVFILLTLAVIIYISNITYNTIEKRPNFK